MYSYFGRSLANSLSKQAFYNFIVYNHGEKCFYLVPYRKAWVKKQRIVHSYGREDEEEEYIGPSELRECLDKEIASGDVQPPPIPSTIPQILEDVDIIMCRW